METPQKQGGRIFFVPADVLADVLRIILKYGLRHYIEGINQRDNTTMLRVFPNPESPHSTDAIQNIAEIVTDYGYYLTGNSGFTPEDEDNEDDFLYNGLP